MLNLALFDIFVAISPTPVAAEDAPVLGGAGVTIIVHGFDAGFGLEPEWTEAMQAAILVKMGRAGNEGVITVEGSEGMSVSFFGALLAAFVIGLIDRFVPTGLR